MYTPHTVTLYNISVEVDKNTFEEKTVHYITVLKGVFLDETKGVNVRASGLESADAATLYIPFSVNAVDGITGKPKRFVNPIEFIEAENKSDFWTLSVGSNSFFIKGVAVEPDKSVSVIENTHDKVFNITKVDEKDYGSKSMRHWEVGGA